MPRVLAVDDEQPILLVLRDYFGARNFDVDCASDLEQARAFLESRRYALVITDLKLNGGGREGFDVVRLAREHSRDAATILLTASQAPDLEREAKQRGVDAVLVKPQALEDLARVARALLEQRGLAPEPERAERGDRTVRSPSEALLQAVLAATPDVVYAKDRDGRYLVANAAAARLAGRTPEELVGKTDEEIYPYELARACRASDRETLVNGTVSEFEETARFGDLERTFLTSKGPLRDGSGRLTGVFGISRDITERKRVEETLRASEERLRLILEHTAEGIYGVDRHGRCTFVNRTAAEMLGYAPADLVGERLHPLIHHTRASGTPYPEEVCPVAAAVELGRPQRVGDEVLWRCDGSSFFVEYSVAPIGADAAQGAVVAFTDVTDRRRAETDLRDSEQRYRLLFENRLTGDFVSQPDGRLLACNATFARILGFESVEEALATSTVTLFHDQAERDALLAAVQAEGRLELREVELRRRDGGPVHVLLTAVGRLDAAGQLLEVQGFLVDETPRRLLEQQLQQAQKMEAVGRLAGGVAHDFNNVLGVIVGYAEILKRRLSDDAELQKPVAEIAKAAQRASGLTRQLLAFSRKQVLRPRLLDLNTLVADIQKMLERILGEDIELVSRLALDLEPVHADPNQLDQVVLNLAVNARDAMPAGGTLTIQTANTELDETYSLAHSGVKPGAYVMLTVSDTGSGMTDQVRERIFEPFFTTKPEGRGTGLGLATVYGIVKQSGGHVWVYSEPGLGTTFKIYLPRVSSGVRRPETSRRSPASPPVGSETVLVVEDQRSMRELTREILLGGGYTVLHVANGAEALALAERHAGTIHLLVTDVVMPGIGGGELAQRLAALRPGLRVLYISGYSDDMIKTHGIVDTKARLLEKPFTPDALLRRVRDLLDEPA